MPMNAAFLGRIDVEPLEVGAEHALLVAFAGAGLADADQAQERRQTILGRAERAVELDPIGELHLAHDLRREIGRRQRTHVRVDRFLVHADAKPNRSLRQSASDRRMDWWCPSIRSRAAFPTRSAAPRARGRQGGSASNRAQEPGASAAGGGRCQQHGDVDVVGRCGGVDAHGSIRNSGHGPLNGSDSDYTAPRLATP